MSTWLAEKWWKCCQSRCRSQYTSMSTSNTINRCSPTGNWTFVSIQIPISMLHLNVVERWDVEKIKGVLQWWHKCDSILVLQMGVTLYVTHGYGGIGHSVRMSAQVWPDASPKIWSFVRIFFFFTIRRRRSIAFQPCKTLGGLHLLEMSKILYFLKANALKSGNLAKTLKWAAWAFLIFCMIPHCLAKIWE